MLNHRAREPQAVARCSNVETSMEFVMQFLGAISRPNGIARLHINTSEVSGNE